MSAPWDTDRRAAIKAVPLFSTLDDAALEHVLRLAAEFDAPAGTVLVEAKREATGLFILLEGTTEVDVAGRSIEHGPGDVIGELAVITDTAGRTARVRAKTAVRGLAIKRADFQELLETEPAIAVAMVELLAKRLAAMAQ